MVVDGFVLFEVAPHHHEQRLLFYVFFNFCLEHLDVLGLLLHSALVDLVFKLHTGEKLLCVDLEILQLTGQLGIVLDLGKTAELLIQADIFEVSKKLCKLLLCGALHDQTVDQLKGGNANFFVPDAVQ